MSKVYQSSLALLFILLLLPSCISTKIESARTDAYYGSAESVLIITAVKSEFRGFMGELAEELQKEFEARGINAQSKQILILKEEERTSIDYAIEKSTADLVLELKQNSASQSYARVPSAYIGGSWTAGGYQTLTTLNLDIHLIDRENQKTIWTASMKLTQNETLMSGRSGKGKGSASIRIIKALMADGLLQPVKKKK
uniref:hypothetical protein n=1 Tax=Roseivirga sp. TaxID=1964215 RepID=UPI004047221A